MSDYDMSIHSNPDAKAWADFFNETLVKRGQQPLDVGVMIGWFANAMMAMHDHIYQTKFPEELSALKARFYESNKAIARLEIELAAARNADKKYWGEDQVKYLQAELSKREADLAAANSDKENLMEAGMKAAIRADRAESKLSETQAKLEEAEHSFKNFHRLLCERFDYGHDQRDWKRDQLSLIEWIAKKLAAQASDFKFMGHGATEFQEFINQAKTQGYFDLVVKLAAQEKVIERASKLLIIQKVRVCRDFCGHGINHSPECIEIKAFLGEIGKI